MAEDGILTAEGPAVPVRAQGHACRRRAAAGLGTYTEGRGCVYVRRLENIDEAVLRELIAIAFAREDDPEPV